MMEEIKCIFCNKNDNPVVIEQDGYQCKRCPDCDLIYVSPRPSYAEIHNLYRDDHAHTPAQTHISISQMPRLYERHHLRIIKKFLKSGSILEIGAGSGTFLDEARNAGFTVYSVEPNYAQADFIRKKFSILCEESITDTLSFKTDKFDIIFHRDVTSHFYDPVGEFRRMYDRLHDSGILVFETGVYGQNKYINLFINHQLPDHLFTFSDKSLNELLDRSGFRILKIYRYSTLLYLLLNRVLYPVRDFIRGKPASGRCVSATMLSVKHSNGAGPSLITFMKKIYFCLFYILVYKIGRLFPKRGRPQKVIVVASKKK